MAARSKLYLKLGSAGGNEQTTSWYYHTDWNVPNPTPIERQLEWLPKELVRVEDYVEVHSGKVCRYPADMLS
jgi:hypothetical protein